MVVRTREQKGGLPPARVRVGAMADDPAPHNMCEGQTRVPVTVQHLHSAVRVAAPLDAQHRFAATNNSPEGKVSLTLTARAQLAAQVLRDPDHHKVPDQQLGDLGVTGALGPPVAARLGNTSVEEDGQVAVAQAAARTHRRMAKVGVLAIHLHRHHSGG